MYALVECLTRVAYMFHIHYAMLCHVSCCTVSASPSLLSKMRFIVGLLLVVAVVVAAAPFDYDYGNSTAS